MLHRLSASEINREPATTVGSLFIYEISLSFLRLLMPFLTAFYAMLAINEATFLQLLIVEYASLNGNDYSLGREFLRAGQGANFSFNGSKGGIVLRTLPRCQRCVSTILPCRKNNQ